ncbi:Cellulose synthase [Macleaya cordata]|uniref:Cellulose synthase n=1 Tax=Macleaya cordata TaxID=56857 RepID=A0A200QCL6_MACCD|nr:Cellulose synthase [Macleaya cordata]
MRGPSEMSTKTPHLHTLKDLRCTALNRIFALIFTSAIFALFYHHFLHLLHSSTTTTFFLHLTLLFSDVILTFMWATTQSFRMRPVRRHVYPENLPQVMDHPDYPKLDVFICTADPYKEPPMGVVNTALSVMAYEYPSDKISVYVSDDGGSELTLFAFMEAAKFATHWLPFCKRNRIEDRCPEAYFSSNHSRSSGIDELKMIYESMKMKVESAVERGCIVNGHIKTDDEREAFKKWTAGGFTRQDHPTVIQVLLESAKHKDITGQEMPNLIYLSRQKSKTSPHHFKAGALNVLLRVSATMTNAPLILTLDCDMYSNDPKTPLDMLCFLLDPKMSKYAYVQFPQRFHGTNKNDIYGGENKRLFQINPIGMDGLAGTNYVGTGTFFRRRAFFGGPSSFLSAENLELNPNHVVDKSIRSDTILKLAHNVAKCDYESDTKWGSKMGFRYGSLVEDYYTGYQLHCEGWDSVFYHPNRAAFLGDIPINLNDVLSQNKRWSVGLLEVAFSKYSPITFGTKSRGILMGLAYSHYAFWPIWSIPISIYAFIPQLALLNGVTPFPKVSDSWFYLYVFLFLGSYIQDSLDFVLSGGTIQRWLNDQRMWLIRGISSYLFGSIDFFLKSFGISSFGFNITSKVVDDEQNKRYEQGIFEFGVASPLFVPLTSTAILNLTAFFVGLTRVILGHGNMEEIFVQLFICGFGMVNCWPVYEAIALRTDKGRMPMKTTMVSTFVALALYSVASLIFQI